MQNRNVLFLVALAMLIAVSIGLGASPASAEETTGKPELFTSGEYRYFVNEDGTASIHAYNGEESELTIPPTLDGYPVTRIGEFAFASSSGPASIIIPEGVTSIGNGAFSVNSNLTSIAIPDGVTSIGLKVFSGCSRLQVIEVSENNPNFSSVDGVLFDKAEKTLLFYPCGKRSRSYAIPAGTTAIGDSAIYYCSWLTSVSIPDSVSFIDYGDFVNCMLLKKIDVAEANPVYASMDGVLFDKARNTLLAYPCAKDGSSYEIPDGTAAIGDAAFGQCKRLTGVVLPDSVTVIGRSAFSGCDRLTSIAVPGGVTSIGDTAFYTCDGLTSVSISDGVTSIGEDAFGFCEKLGEIVVSEDNPTFESIDGVLFARSPKVLMFYPNAKRRRAMRSPGVRPPSANVLLEKTTTSLPSQSRSA